MTGASKAAIERGVELANLAFGAAALWSKRDYNRNRKTTFSVLCDYIQKVSDIAERCADPATTDKDRYEALQELIVKDVDPLAEALWTCGEWEGKDGFAKVVRDAIDRAGYRLVKDE